MCKRSGIQLSGSKGIGRLKKGDENYVSRIREEYFSGGKIKG